LYIRQFIGISYFTPLSPLYKGEKQENPVLFIKGETRKSSPLYKGGKQENPVLFIQGRNKKIQFSLYRGETRKSSSLYKGEKQENPVPSP
jgi:hypothetical protein